MPLGITIVQQGPDYIFTWDPVPGAASAIRADRADAPLRRLATAHLDARSQADLQEAIGLAAQVAHRVARRGAEGGLRGLAAIQSLERLGRVMFSQLLPAALQDVLRDLPPVSPLFLTTNDSHLPWELLHDDQEFLALRYAVGRQLLTGEGVRASPGEPRERLSCLLIGNPTGDLPAADAEIEALIDVLDAAPRRVRAELLCRDQASKVQVLEALAGGQYDVVHYAGHARPGALRLADGWLDTDEVRASLRGQPLIFLNACASAQEESLPDDALPFAGQQARNLASAFLLGGAGAFVGTLWPIFDDAAQALAADFYRAVVRGRPIGEALRAARMRCRQAAPGELVWASLVLYGDPLHRVMTSGLSYHSGTVLVARFPDSHRRWQEGHIETAVQAAHREAIGLAHAIVTRGGKMVAPGTSRITAVFGVPRTFEDDAQRALHAALHIQRSTADGEAGQPAIGVASGDIAVAGATDHGSRIADHGPLYLGPAVTEALHLARQAQPGQVLAGAMTRRLAGDAFHFVSISEDEGDVTAYDVSPPRELITPSTSSGQGATAQQPAESALIGRAGELDALTIYWQAAQRGHGQVVGIVGEAGIGKSRLLQAFRQAIAGEDHVWLEAACPSTGHEAPYTLLAQLLRPLFSVTPEDDAAVVKTKIEQRLGELPGSAGAGSELVEILKEVLGLSASETSTALSTELSSEARKARRGRLVYLLRSMLAGAVRQSPLVVALEDMHWVDEASLEILDQVTDGINRLPVQVLVVYRPDWDHPWFHKPYYRHLPLEPLDEAARVHLLHTLLGTEELPPRLLAVLERSGGNPFFTEELVKSLRETGVLVRENGTWTLTQPLTEAQLPGTVQRTLLARLDRLPAETRQVLQVASVIGPAFAPALLTEVVPHLDPALDRHLAELEDRGFVYARWDTGDYVFRHALIQETAYASLPVARRRVHHRHVGETLERRGDTSQADVETLAHHFYHSLVIPVAGGQPVLAEDANPDQLQKATGYLTQAGDRARERYAAREALNYYRRGLTVSQRLPDNEDHLIAIHEGASDAHHLLSDFDEAIRHLRQALAVLHTRPLSRVGRRRAADLARRVGFLYGWKGEYETASDWMREGLRELGRPEDEDDKATAALLYVHTGVVRYYEGNLEVAVQQCQAGLELAEAIDQASVQAAAHNTLAVIHTTLSQHDEALAHGMRSLEIWQRLGDAYQTARVENNIGNIHSYRGNWEKARPYYERSLAFWEQVEDQDWIARVELNLGGIYLYQGNWGRARQSYARALELSEKVQNHRMIARTHNNLGLLYVEQGAWDRAEEHLKRSQEVQHRLKIQDILAETFCGLAEVALGQQQVDQAVELARKAVTVAEELDMRFEQAIALRVLGRAYVARGEPVQAQEYLKEGLAILENLHSLYEMGRTLYHLAVLEASVDRDEEAQDHLRRARAIFEEVGAAKDLERARA
jgi:predicted ATPase